MVRPACKDVNDIAKTRRLQSIAVILGTTETMDECNCSGDSPLERVSGLFLGRTAGKSGKSHREFRDRIIAAFRGRKMKAL